MFINKFIHFLFWATKKLILVLLLILVPLILIVTTASYVWLQTQPGQSWLGSKISAQLTRQFMGNYGLTSVRISLPGTVEIKGLSVHDDQGRLRVVLPKLLIESNPLDFFHNNI